MKQAGKMRVDKLRRMGFAISAYLPSLWRKPSSNVAGFLLL
jgi:hypothetical protein